MKRRNLFKSLPAVGDWKEAVEKVYKGCSV